MDIEITKTYYADLSGDNNVSVKYQKDKVKVSVILESAHNVFKVGILEAPGRTTHVLRSKLSSIQLENAKAQFKTRDILKAAE